MKFLLFLLCLVGSAILAQADERATRETQWLKDVRSTTGNEQANALSYLAIVREERGKFREALATWRMLNQRFGKLKASSAGNSRAHTYGQRAAFFSQRIRRKQNLAAKPPRVSSELRYRLAQAATSFGDAPPGDQLDMAVQADLDGDGIDEWVYKVSNGPLGKRTQKTWGIARWNGKAYRVVWKGSTPVPFMIHVRDEDGDGWKEVFCGWTPDTDDAATLYWNGQSVLFL